MWRFVALCCVSACSILGAEGEGEVDVNTCELQVEPTIESIHENVFRRSCAFARSCHSQLDLSGGLILACSTDSDGDGRLDTVVPTSPDQVQAACWGLVARPSVNPNESDATVRVVAGNAKESFLVRKLEGRDLAQGQADNCPMPYTSDCVVTSDACMLDMTAAIKEWIDTGAAGCEKPPVDVTTIDWDEYCQNGGLQ